MSIALSQYKNRDRVLIIEAGRLHPSVSFARASTAMVRNSVGTLVQVATNVPRYEYSAAGVYLGLLIEEARTNLFTYSDGDVTTYPTRGGVTAATTPLAAYFSNSVQFPSTGGTNYAYKAYTLVANTTYTLSAFVEMDDMSAPRPSNQQTSSYDFAIVVNGLLVSNYAVVYQGGGVYRVSGTISITAININTTGIAQYSSQSKKGFRVTGYQLEVGASATSYIPTTTAAATRSSDVCSVTTLSNISFNASEGSFVCKVVHGTWTATQQTYFVLNNATLANRIQIRRETASTTNLALIQTSSVTQASFTQTSGGDGSTNKIAMAYKLNDIAGSCNGISVGTDTVATIPTVTQLQMGNNVGGNFLNGWITYLAYHPKKRLNTDYPRLSV